MNRHDAWRASSRPLPALISSAEAGESLTLRHAPAIAAADLRQLPADRRTLPRAPATRDPWERFTAGRWPLVAILVTQAVLSVHLIWANTAFLDEALYLVTGHLEWSHWLHGGYLPAFQTYFSGAPVIYPPIAAAADAVGGLAAARALSLCFMLGASTALHGVTKRIFGRPSAVFAAALFAGVGATQYLGAFATYDALALSLLAAATWLGVRAAGSGTGARLVLLILAGLVLALADATKYAAALFDPVVISTAACFSWRREGRLGGFRAGVIMCAVLTLAIGGALLAAGPGYWQGITFSTLTRASGTSPPSAVLFVSLGWAGAVAAVAIIGAATVICTFRDRAYNALGITLALAVWLAPAEQARIETFTSLFKHIGFGEWFGAILGGFALASLTSAVPRVKAEGALRVAWLTVIASAVAGLALAANQFATWPNASALVSALRPVLRGDGHSVLADNGDVVEYYLFREEPDVKEYSINGQGQSGSIGAGFSYRAPSSGALVSGLSAYRLAVKNGYFSVITLSDDQASIGADEIIRNYIEKNHRYRLMITIPYTAAGHQGRYQVWVYRRAR